MKELTVKELKEILHDINDECIVTLYNIETGERKPVTFEDIDLDVRDIFEINYSE